MIAKNLMDSNTVTLSAEATLEEVLDLIRRLKITDYPVVDSSMNYCGMLFEAEFFEKFCEKATTENTESLDAAFWESMKADFYKVKVRDVMNGKVRAFTADEPIEAIAAVMLFEKAPKVAVIDPYGKVIGVVGLNRTLLNLIEKFSSKAEEGKAARAISAPPPTDFQAEDPRNKRFFKRTAVTVPVAYRPASGNGKGSSEGKIAKTINVSAGGLLILTKEPLAPGESLNVALDIYQNNQPIRMVCRIVRCLPSPQPGAYEVGLMFVAIGIDERRRLDAHFEKGSA